MDKTEHGWGSVIASASWEKETLQRVQREIDKALPNLSRQDFLKDVLAERAYAVLTRDREQAVAFSHPFSPEHLSISTQHPVDLAPQIPTPRAIFLGNNSPAAAGDFFAGTSPWLPHRSRA